MTTLQSQNMPLLSNEGFNQPLRIRKGATFRPTITVVDPDGNVFPLTGYTIQASLRKYPERTPKIDFTYIETNPEQGECEIELASTVTKDLVSGDNLLNRITYTWDCDIVETATGIITPFCHGDVSVAEGDTTPIPTP